MPRAGASPQSQWPPPEWGVRPSTHTVPHSRYPAYANQSQSSEPSVGPSVGNAPSGVNISGPKTFSASSYGGNLRPGSSHSSRPSNPTTPLGSFPSYPISEKPMPSSAYPVLSSYNPQSVFSGGPPQPRIAPVAPTPDASFHCQTHGPVHGAHSFFNMSSPPPYLPPFLLTTNPGQAAGPFTHPGQQQSSAYPPSNYGKGGWLGGPPPSSPPAIMPTLSGQSNNSRPYGGPTQGPLPQTRYPGGSSFPSSHQPSTLGSPGR